MTFYEACIKGNLLKRAGWPEFIPKGHLYYILDTWCVPPFGVELSTEDMKATDWEIGDL